MSGGVWDGIILGGKIGEGVLEQEVGGGGMEEEVASGRRLGRGTKIEQRLVGSQ